MANVPEPRTDNGEHLSRLELVEGGAQTSWNRQVFGQDWGAPLEFDTMLATARVTDTPSRVVQVVLDYVLPSELSEDSSLQEHIHQLVAAADTYYRTEVWPTYPRGTADIDKVIQLFEATEEQQNCTLLHTLRSFSEEDPHNAEKYKDAERIAQILILNEMTLQD